MPRSGFDPAIPICARRLDVAKMKNCLHFEKCSVFGVEGQEGLSEQAAVAIAWKAERA
jgi:hypothetical protein